MRQSYQAQNEQGENEDRSRFQSRSTLDGDFSEETCEIHSESGLLGSESPSSQRDIHFIESTDIKTKNSVEWVTLFSSLETLSFDQEFEEYEENESVWSVVKNRFLYLID